jgi:DNA polymerase delta subunit 2
VHDWLTCFENNLKQEMPLINLTTKPKYVLLVSGMEINSLNPESIINGHILADFINGLYGSAEMIHMADSIVKIILSGNSIANIVAHNHGKVNHNNSNNKSNNISRSSYEFDVILSQILTSCSVDVIPGETDPVNYLLPQQPIHPCILPLSTRFNNLRLCSNPYESNLENFTFLGHSGLAIQDIMMQTLHVIS